MAKFLTILIVEASIEPFPEDLLKDIKARQYLSKANKSPEDIMLDANQHGHLMESLPDKDKRGRPDIVHFTLLSCFGSILAREHRLNVMIHTIGDKIISLNPDIRLPKNVDRFNGLILQLFKDKQIPPKTSEPLMTLGESSLPDLINKLRLEHDLVIEFSVKGEQLSSSNYSKLIYEATNPLLIFGAFPHGEIESLPHDLVDKKIAIYEEGLDLFAVVSQILASQQLYEENFLSKSNGKTNESLAWE
jgi:rRNA small subunit pseudouridine methyltransferase Nep1